ncbi:MAG: VWA domain-containing protein [Pseudomonadales bacterium]
MIEGAIASFHFLRPEWLYALIPAVLIFIIIKTRESRGSNWEETIDLSLLPFLLDDTETKTTRSPMSLLLIAWIIATVALAGPAFRKLPQPVHEREDALIILLDLSYSMYATDVQPDRLTRARRKLSDLFDMRNEGVTGLIVYAGDAHTVAPLTDDTGTILGMLQSLSPDIMPASGSRLSPALELAHQRFHDAGATTGRILVLTDEIRDRARAIEIAREHRGTFPVSLMAVGTLEGAPIPLQPGSQAGYLKDNRGNLVIPKVDPAALRDFAASAGGRFSRMTLTNDDLDYLLDETILPMTEEFREVERNFDVWREEGPWLILLLLPLAALAFRRGWLWSLALVVTLHSEPADALSWEDIPLTGMTWADLWKTPDQQGMEALQAGDPEAAAKHFEDPGWRGTARYRAEDYENAASQFANIETSEGKYNYGNALAKQGQLQQAIEAYDEALTLDPDNEDAAYNKRLVEDLLEQQQRQNKQNQDGDDQSQDQQQQNQQDQSGESGDSEQQEQQSQRQDQQNQDHEQDQQDQEADSQQQKAEQDEQKANQQQMAEQDVDPLEGEERQALEQWLRRVPDDPGGLLRRKFEREYEERLRRGEIENDDTRDW